MLFRQFRRIRLSSLDEGVRSAAVEALTKLVERGDQPAIAAVSARCEDPAWGVRSAAASAIIQAVKASDEGKAGETSDC